MEERHSQVMIGRQVSHYRILERLGGGGMGEVFKAEDLRLGRPVALKFLPPELGEDPVARERFVQEAKAASALDHQNICAIHDIDETEDGRLFLAMAFYEGETLKKRLAAGSLPIDEALGIAEQVAEGLAKAHAAGITHRDVKPANLMITRDGVVKIVDFGLAKLAGEPGLTRTGMSVGTPVYMSPEQARGEAVDHRTDLWALGVVLYEMLAGQRPFEGASEGEVLHSILYDEPEPVSELRSGLPRLVVELVPDLLVRDPGKRPGTAREALERIRTARQEAGELSAGPTLTWPGVADGRPERQARSRAAWAAALVLVVALAALGGALWLQGTREEAGVADAGPVAETALADRKMIVVLPFENLGGPEHEYFAAGMTEEFTSRLAAVHALGVISRNTAVHYPAAGKTMQEIGQDLGVAYVLEGTVRWAPEDGPGRVRITPQLIRTADDTHLWADAYDATLDDVFRVQSEIAERVVGELEITLLASERETIERRPTESTEAYNAYLRGLYLLSRRDLEGAAQHFQEAVAGDPGFPQAWAGLGDAYLRLGGVGQMPLKEGCERARQAVERALDLDDGPPGAWAVLANLRRWCDLDWAGADEAAREALARGPSSVEALRAATGAAQTLGRHHEAIELARRAVELDPINMGSLLRLGSTLRNAGRLEDAEATYRKALDLGPEDTVLPRLGFVHLFQGRAALALEEVAQERRPGYRLFYLALAYHDLGRLDEAEAALAELIEDHGDAMAFQIAGVYAYWDRVDTAFEWLARALAQRDPGLAGAGSYPGLDNLHDDPRWKPFLEELGLD